MGQTPLRPKCRSRGPAAALALASGAVAFTLVAVEIALRAIPALLPTGSYGHGVYDPELRMNIHGGTVVYNKMRRITRVPNRAGFMDVDHDPGKPLGTVRVGFFGDSFVEAIQVPLDAVFFRRLPDRMGGKRLESLGFGISGWGILHSLLNARVQVPRYDVDAVVYVFVENDPGDGAWRLQRHRPQGLSPKPAADLADGEPGFAVVWIGEPVPPGPALRLAKFVQSRSLLAQVVWSRVALLREGGIAARERVGAASMTEQASEHPDANSPPSTWPQDLRDHVELLSERILARFAHEMRAAGRTFTVLYVPRGEAQLTGTLDLASTWRPWLGLVCARHSIPLLDPSAALRARDAAGDSVYDDHWTPAGHEVIAAELSAYLEGQLSRPALAR